MLSSVISQITTEMAEGGKVVSKRSARTYTEDEMEATAANDHHQLLRMTKQHDEATVSEDRGRRNSALASSSNQSSRQTSIEATPAMSAVTESQWGQDVTNISTDDDGRNYSSDSTAFSTLAETEDDGAILLDTFQMHQSRLEIEENLPIEGRPANFGIVIPGIYRSSFPQADDHEFISHLKLKTIVTLVQKDFPEGYDAFVRKNGINHHVFDMRGTKKERIPDKTMKAILGLVLNEANHPLLIHCNHGKHRTGCVVGVVRILAGWDMGRIVAEYKSYAEPKVRECDIEYITGFQPASFSTNLFARDANAQIRFQRFAVVTIVVLCLWVVSGKNIPQVPADRRLT